MEGGGVRCLGSPHGLHVIRGIGLCAGPGRGRPNIDDRGHVECGLCGVQA